MLSSYSEVCLPLTKSTTASTSSSIDDDEEEAISSLEVDNEDFDDIDDDEDEEDEEISYEGYISDIEEKICSCLDFKALSVIFKVDPKGEILDVRCKINEAETKRNL